MAIRPLLGRSSSREVARVDAEFAGSDVLVPLVGGDDAVHVDQARVAIALANTGDGRIHVVDPLGDRGVACLDATAGPEEVLEYIDAHSIGATQSGVLSGRRSNRRILEYVEDSSVDALVVPGQVGPGALGRRRHDRLAAAAPCEVISVGGAGRFRDFASILLPVAEGPHTKVATAVAGRIAAALDAWIDVLHVLPDGVDDDRRDAAMERLESLGDRIGRPNTVNPWILEADDPAETIVEQSTYYGLTVIGAPSSGRLRRFFHGSTSREIRREADSLVIAARTRSSG